MSDNISDILQIKQAQEEFEKLSKSIIDTSAKMETIAKSMANVTKAVKADATTKQKTEQTEKLSVATKNYLQQQKTLTDLTEKARVVEGNYNIAINKKRIELQEANKNIRENIKLNKVQKGSLTDIEIRLKRLTDEYKRTAKPSKELVKNIQDLDKRSKALSATIGQNQKNVGGYAQSLQKVVVGIGGFIVGVKALFNGLSSIVNKTIELNKQTLQTQKLFAGTNKESERLTKNIRAIASAYDKDFNDVLKSTNVLAKEFGISGQQSLELIEKGFRGGADATGEYLDILKEYPSQLRQVGLNAEETIAVITQTQKEGVFSDKGIDAIKEAGIRLRELTPATRKALDQIGLSSTEIENSLRDGSKSLFDVIQQVSNKLGELPEQSAEVGTALADIFGGAGEDAGLRFLKTLGGISTELEVTKTSSENASIAAADLKKEWSLAADSFVSGSGFISRALVRVIDFLKETTKAVRQLNMSTEDLALEVTYDDAVKNVEKFKKSITTTNDEQIKANNILIQQYTEYLSKLTSGTTEYNELNKVVVDLTKANEELSKSNKELDKDDFVQIYESQIKQLQEVNKEQEKFLDDENLDKKAKRRIQSIIATNKNEIFLYKDLISQLNTITQTGIDPVLDDDNVNQSVNKVLELIDIAKRDLEDIGDVVIDTKPIDDFYDQFEEKEIDWITEREKRLLENAEKVKAIEEDIQNSKQQLLERGFEIATDISNRQAERRIFEIEQEQELLNESFNQQKILYEGNAEALLELDQRQIAANKQKEAEKKKIAMDAAKRERAILIAQKAITLFQIYTNTTAAAAAAVAPPPLGVGPVLGAPLAAATKIKGLIDAALVIAQPIPPLPKFYKGTDNFEGGFAVVGDRYGTEGIITPQGKAMLTPDSDTLAYMPKGTQVIPHEKLATHPIFGQKSQVKEMNRFDDRRIVKAIMNKKETSVNITEAGIFGVVKRGTHVNRYKSKILNR